MNMASFWRHKRSPVGHSAAPRGRALATWSAMLLACHAVASLPAAAQQATVGTPVQTMRDGFYEQSNIHWGLNWPGGFFRFGPTPTAPPFGGYDPNAGGRFGFGFGGSGLNGFFLGEFSQGSRRSFVGQTPMVTMINGVPASIVDQAWTPFVMGVVPVVGDEPEWVGPSSGVGSDAVRDMLRARRRAQGSRNEPRASQVPRPDAEAGRAAAPRKPTAAVARDAAKPVAADEVSGRNEVNGRDTDSAAEQKVAMARQSSAGRAAPSVAEAKRLRAEEMRKQHDEARAWWEKGLSAEDEGNLGAAKGYYQMAARRADDALKRRVLSRLNQLNSPHRSPPAEEP